MEKLVNKNESILDVKDLKVSYHTYAGEVQSVRGVSFDVARGEVLAIVGESGCGKSVTARAIMSLILGPQGEIKDGSKILYNGEDILGYDKKRIREFRGGECAMIFQDALTSLNPTMKVGNQITENLVSHRSMDKKSAREEAIKILESVGIPNAKERIDQYPHQFSGGMRQRIVIAIALACNPDVLIADEPTTALDVTIQAQIIDLIKDLQHKIGLSIIFITHDLGVVATIADRIAVMYAGKIVEIGTVEDIFYDPRHPYTWGLLGSLPTLDSQDDYLYNIPGMPPNLLNPPKGDAFAIRNKNALKIDYEKEPPMFKINDTHSAATWLLHPDAPEVDVPVRVNCGRVISNE